MDFTPIAPTQLDGSVKNELLVLAEEIVIKCRDAKNLASARIHTWPLDA